MCGLKGVLSSDSGTVLIFGLDVLLNKSFSIGLEARQVSIEIKERDTFLDSGVPATDEGTFDGDYKTVGIRFALRF